VSRRVVVTGGGGFVGQWLGRALLELGDQVWLAGPGKAAPDGTAILTPKEWSSVQWLPTDIRKDDDVARLFSEARPDLVVHLAGISHVPDAEGAPIKAYEVNVVGAVRLLSAAAAARTATGLDPLMLVIGSGTQYGDHPASAMPLPETAEQRPLSAYAATKAAQEVAVLHLGRMTGLRVICTRSFSHSGVGHASMFLVPSLVSRVRELAKNGGQIQIGNDVVRDYLHVTDAVSAYLALADRGTPGEVYNVCSGVAVTVRDLAAKALERAGVKAEIVSAPGLQRRADMHYLVGSPAKLTAATGWRATKSLDDVFDDLLAVSP
jgi:GDP-4-dehydro-6-deoxy-D-mannose reductase